MNRNKQITVAILAGTFVGMSYRYVFKAGVWLGKIVTYKDIINYVDGIKKGGE